MVIMYKYTTKTEEKPVKNNFLYKRNGLLCKYYLCKNDRIGTTKGNNCWKSTKWKERKKKKTKVKNPKEEKNYGNEEKSA